MVREMYGYCDEGSSKRLQRRRIKKVGFSFSFFFCFCVYSTSDPMRRSFGCEDEIGMW